MSITKSPPHAAKNTHTHAHTFRGVVLLMTMAVHYEGLSDCPPVVHPSVLITVLTSNNSHEVAPFGSSTKETSVPLSGSAFILGEDSNGASFVVTSAYWLSSIMDIGLESCDSNPAIVWRYHRENKVLKMIVLMEKNHIRVSVK